MYVFELDEVIELKKKGQSNDLTRNRVRAFVDQCLTGFISSRQEAIVISVFFFFFYRSSYFSISFFNETFI